KGAGLRVLTETVSSPTLADQLAGDREGALLRDFPEARWYQYDPARSDYPLEGSRLAFSAPVNTVYDFTKADVIVALDADFLSCGPAHLRYAHDFMSRRRVRGDAAEAAMNRLYAVEPMPSNTGAVADHRLPLRVADVEGFARAL